MRCSRPYPEIPRKPCRLRWRRRWTRVSSRLYSGRCCCSRPCWRRRSRRPGPLDAAVRPATATVRNHNAPFLQKSVLPDLGPVDVPGTIQLASLDVPAQPAPPQSFGDSRSFEPSPLLSRPSPQPFGGGPGRRVPRRRSPLRPLIETPDRKNRCPWRTPNRPVGHHQDRRPPSCPGRLQRHARAQDPQLRDAVSPPYETNLRLQPLRGRYPEKRIGGPTSLLKAVAAGCAPFAPHLLYPGFMDDGVPSHREAALPAVWPIWRPVTRSGPTSAPESPVGCAARSSCDAAWQAGCRVGGGVR